MPNPLLSSARDYNQGLAAPVRWAHIITALLRPAFAPLFRWATSPSRRTWAPPLLLALPLILIFLPFDGPIARLAARHPLSGDAKRELEALQQYGQAVSSILVALVIYLQDPPRRRELLNWAAAMLAAFLIVVASKAVLGRPRPDYDDPWVFLGPLGQYPIGPGKGVHHAWEIWASGSYKLASMPSSHTAYAFVMAAFLASLYPRLRSIVYSLAAVVGLARIITHGHYPTDVIAGAAIGLAISRAAIADAWGTRLLVPRARAV